MISFGRKKSKVIRISWSTRCFCLLVASFFNSFYFLFIFLFIGWASRLPMHKTRESNTKWPNSKPPVDMCSSFSQVSCFVALFIHGLRCCISWLFFSRLQNDVLLNATNRLHKYSVVRSLEAKVPRGLAACTGISNPVPDPFVIPIPMSITTPIGLFLILLMILT